MSAIANFLGKIARNAASKNFSDFNRNMRKSM